MLLSSLILQLGVHNFALSRTSSHSLDQIGQFEFGERYCIMLLSQQRIEVRQLDTILSAVIDEYKLAETYDLTLHMAGKKGKTLILKPKAVLGRPWGRDVPKTCAKIQDWVTHFNLTETWPDEALGLTVNNRWSRT